MKDIIRTTIEIPEYLHQKVKILADKIGIPTSGLIVLMIVEQTSYLKGVQEDIEDKKRNSKEKWKINLSFEVDYYHGNIRDILDEKGCSFNDFANYCIRKQYASFSAIVEGKEEEYIRNLKVSHNSYVNQKERKNSKPIPLIEQYLDFKCRQTGISKKTLEKYYIAKAVNNDILTNPNEKKLFTNFGYKMDILDYS